MGRFSVTRQGADILVNANPEDVFRVLAANATWKTEREFLNSSETLSFVVFGRFWAYFCLYFLSGSNLAKFKRKKCF